MNKNLKVDQVVFVKRINNASRFRSKEDLIFEAKITRIGKKYFYIISSEATWKEEQISISDFCQATNYVPDYKVFLTRKEIDEEEEYNEKLKKVQIIFGGYRAIDIGIDKMRKIHDILFEEEK